MKIYLGEEGLNKTWQNPFPKTVKCYKCGGKARIMFVGFEDGEGGNICGLHDNMKDGKYWTHDCCAVAVYLCECCFEPNALINQA